MNLFHHIDLYSPSPASDGQGGEEEGWTLEHTCRANFRFLRGGETVQSARLTGKQPVVMTVRDCRELLEINSHWKIRDKRTDTDYNVRSVVLTDDRLFLEITAESGVAI